MGARARRGQLHCDSDAASGARDDGERSVVRLADALDDREAEADAGMVAADAFGAALEGLGERRDQPGRELLTGVLDDELRAESSRAPC